MESERKRKMRYELEREDRIWAEELWKKLSGKLEAECLRLGDMIPGDVGENGRYVDMGKQDIYWWTNGFWAGTMWQMYHAADIACCRAVAEWIEAALDQALCGFSGLHHDVGFMWLHTAVANYRLTGNETSYSRGLHAANILAGRYNPNGRFIRAWNPECDPSIDTKGIAIIDCMMNLPLLYWASDVTGDIRFRSIAMNHADRVLECAIRPDGSSNHIVEFNPETGEFLGNPGGQGYESGSSWSRGQSWAIYGMALSYAHTGKQEYLDAAKRTAHYFMGNAALNGYVPLVDFRSPGEPVLVDTTAGAIAACGLLEIADHVGKLEKGLYVKSALRILQALEAGYCNWNPEEDAVLGGGTVAYHGRRNCPIIYGDYFFLEAVLRLLDQEFLIW